MYNNYKVNSRLEVRKMRVKDLGYLDLNSEIGSEILKESKEEYYSNWVNELEEKKIKKYVYENYKEFKEVIWKNLIVEDDLRCLVGFDRYMGEWVVINYGWID
jgi:hypothetical protein